MANIKEFGQAIENEGHFAVPKTFIVDSTSDLEFLPSIDKAAWGSFAICLENGETYALRESGEWEVFG